MEIRPERHTDVAVIRELTTTAFYGLAHSSGAEARIIEGLRAAGALSVSLVAVEEDQVLGHVACSPVTITPVQGSWFGLGPVSVRPDRQRSGIGQTLIRAALQQLRTDGAAGCVLLGDPAYYRRFGFRSDPALTYRGAASTYFQRLVLRGPPARGDVSFHPAFQQ
ncbi:GNAT family N-acetyltransferase [Phenylobacterium terrae]|uniref:GNAT family N-acetyltransferase n=1 Tax=Phenylobacterium terrae TaxID=2665495 RepID=A0ABW4N4W2_9CAUL